MRLDVALLEKYKNINRSKAKKLIKSGLVKLGGAVVVTPSRKVSDLSKIKLSKRKTEDTKHVKFSVKVIYEDKDCLVINKPPGMLSHSKGDELEEQTVASWLADYLKIKPKTNRDLIVHRLDRATSGVMILAKNEQTHKFLQKQFSTRKADKHYKALTSCRPRLDEAIIEVPIERDPKKPQQFRASENGRPAKTHYKLAKQVQKSPLVLLVDLHPTTGRTHQLRVHMRHIGCPLLGDTLYGGAKASRLYLHAYSLKIKLPRGEEKKFVASLPSVFTNPKI
jgi:23S rRNA pseudouridine1911/1915/1917 synthase